MGEPLRLPLGTIPHIHSGETTLTESRLLKPATISRVGTFQDGGLRHNNPINIAMWENQALWPHKTVTDVVLSLGTGSDLRNSLQSPQASLSRNCFQDSFLPRVYRSFMTSIDGECVWGELQNRLQADMAEAFFRFNLFLKEKEPEIDDVGCMDQLRQTTAEQLTDRDEVAGACLALLASCFYWELMSKPTWLADVQAFRCVGDLRCRGRCEEIGRVWEELAGSQTTIRADTEEVGTLKLRNNTCPSCSKFRQPLELLVKDLDTVLALSLVPAKRSSRSVSGFPQSI